MKDAISLLAAILGLSTAVIVLLAALNKTDTVEVPVIREVSVLQPSNPPPAPAPTTTESTETPHGDIHRHSHGACGSRFHPRRG